MKRTIQTFLTSLFTLFAVIGAMAEGTNPVSPNSNQMSALLVASDLGSGAYLNCPEDNRVYFDIKNHAVEKLYFGFDWRQYTASGGDAPRLRNLYFRIRRPDGSVAMGPTLWNPDDLGIGVGGTGVINGYNRAFNGPNIGSVSNGYTPIVFDPDVNGSYWFEFYRSNDNGATMASAGSGGGSNPGRAIAPLFDITVANSSSFQVYNGRLHSDKWAFLACEPGTFRNITHASASPTYYAYTTDSTTVKVRFEPGFEPIAYNFAVNSYGVTPITGNNPFTVSRNSTYNSVAPSLLNGYKVFLNIPDPALYPPGNIPASPQLVSPIMSGCGPYFIHFQMSAPGDIKILLNLNGLPGYQEGTADRVLEGPGLPAGVHTIEWDGLNGLGVPVSGGTTIKLTTTILKGRFNVPLYDAEINKGGMTIDIISPYFGRPDKIFWNDSFLTNIGNTCDNNGNTQQNNLTGAGLDNSVNGVTNMPTRAWNGDGNFSNVEPAGSVSNNDMDENQCNDFGNVRTLNLWGWGVTVYSAEADITFGCPPNTTYAIHDENSTWVNVPVSGNVTHNDFDPQGDVQTFGSFLNQTTQAPIPSGSTVSGVNTSGAAVSNAGTITFNANGTYTFTPSTGFIGVVTIPYNICDNGSPTACDTSYLAITVSPLPTTGINSIIANNDENISYGVPVYGNVVSNDIDPQGDAFSVTAVTGSTPGASFTVSGTNLNGTPNANAGTLVINSDGTYTFTPTPAFVGSIDVPYTITDIHGATATAVLHIDVFYDINGISNNPPFAGDDFSYTPWNTQVSGSFINNDYDFDGDSLSFSGITINTAGPHNPIGGPVATNQGGTIQFYSDGTYTYTPPTGYSGPDYVNYSICDVTTVAPQPLCSQAMIHILVAPGINISGNVYDDANGLTDATINGTGTNAGGLNAILLNGSTVVAVTSVNPDGTYSFTNTNPGTYSVLITTANPNVGDPAPAVTLPNGWVNTGEGTTPSGDGTVNGQTNTFAVTNTDISGVNFGINQVPTADPVTASSQVNPGGTTQVSVPTLTGSDPEDGTYTGVSGTNTIIIQTVPSNGTLYYNGTPVTNGQTITNYDPTLLTLDPDNGAVTVTFTYSEVDAAGTPSAPNTVVMPFTTVSVSGHVFNDVDGMTDGVVDGTGTNAGGLNAILLDGATVVAVVPVDPDGYYDFTSVSGGTYTVVTSTANPNVGDPAPVVMLPAGWVNTGEGTTAAGDGNVNGQTNTFSVTTVNVSNVNFGIEQLPTPLTITAPGQENPEGTNQVTVPPGTFGGTDPSGGIITSIIITGFPTNVTSIVINGTTYTSVNFPTGGVQVPTSPTGEPTQSITIDPDDGLVIVTIPYVVIDNASQTSTSTGNAIIPFITTLPVTLLDFNAYKNGNVADLKWTTEQEMNSSHFEIERSADGRKFDKIGRTEAAGNSNGQNVYLYTDSKPLNGTNYYRLKMVDRDGSYAYSSVRMLKFVLETKLDVYPNPATSFVNISFPADWIGKDATIEMYNNTGQRVNRMLLWDLMQTFRIRVENLPNGTYHLKISLQGQEPEVRTIQVVK